MKTNGVNLAKTRVPPALDGRIDDACWETAATSGKFVLCESGEMGVPAQEIGETGGDRLRIAPGVDVALSEAHDVWTGTLPEALG